MSLETEYRDFINERLKQGPVQINNNLGFREDQFTMHGDLTSISLSALAKWSSSFFTRKWYVLPEEPIISGHILTCRYEHSNGGKRGLVISLRQDHGRISLI